MAKEFTKTVRIRKVGKAEPVELELVSTNALEKILKSEGGKTRSEIRKLAAGRKDGVLARDMATGRFRIVSEADLRNALPARPADKPKRDSDVTAQPISEKARRAADELSLVSTQILRKVLKPADGPAATKPWSGKKDKFGGFNPYDNN